MTEEEELFAATRAAIERKWPKTLEHPDHPLCTGIAASWCDIHGQCQCQLDKNSACPLHGDITDQRPESQVQKILNLRMGIFCEHCDAEMDRDQFDLSTIKFRRALCVNCFRVVQAGGVLRPNPTRKTR